MASVGQPLSGRDPFADEPQGLNSALPKSLPILTSTFVSSRADPMEVTQSHTPSMGPPASSPNGEKTGDVQGASDRHTSVNGSSMQPVGAAAAAQQPKVVQTAFIHKLYNMLEDQSIQHLISWSSSNESFVMSPSSEFSKVLAQYFKHTNISSFVRQLNMYGFHKVSDVFHTGSPDSPLWEFKHGAGSFKRGDLLGLREIKRRASRHALIHRDSFSTAPKLPSLAQTPGTPLDPMPDPIEARLNMLEWSTQELHARLLRTEEAYTSVTSKCHILLDGLNRCYNWHDELSAHLVKLIPDAESPVRRDIHSMRQDILRCIESMRVIDEAQDSLTTPKSGFESGMTVSPRLRPHDESRRPSLGGRSATMKSSSGVARAPVPSYLQMSPRRHGSLGNMSGNGAYSPSPARPAYLPTLPPPPPQPPLQQQAPPPQLHAPHTTPPSSLFARRHTSADIRSDGWDAAPPPASHYNTGTSPNASGQSSSAWPSSPRATAHPGDQQIRDQLAQYELPRPGNAHSRPASPAPPHDSAAPTFSSGFGSSYANSNDAGWQLPGTRFPFKGLETPGPPTRRSSMASNVHSLLNPAETAEREGEGDGPDERKRKRVL